MKEIDDVLLKTIGMDVQQLYSKYGHKKDWKDFLADVYEIVEKSKEITLTIQNFRKIIGHYDTISIEEDYKDYEMLIDWNGRRINAVISRTKNVEGGDYNMDFRSGNIHQTYSIERSEVTIDTIIYKISYFIYNNLEQLPF